MIHQHEPATEPIAIVGIGLRYPGGATDVESFWELMANGVDAITEIPSDRWSISKFYHPTPGATGKTYSKWGGFIDNHDQFDARLFGISAGEAENMDPQQRLLLEASWHALEDGGYPLDRSVGGNIGVFVGVSTGDYSTIGTSMVDYVTSSPFSATGGARSITANRVSHALNLRGPSIAFDTACSSSLVALHYACASIRSGDCDEALVGGVNYILDPSTWTAFCGMTALSKDGRCKAFDASADGFVRSEGVGVVLLKPLSRAIADGDRIYASIRSTSSNQDGRTPAIAMPDQLAQENLIRDALHRADLEPHEISYVEAHGTGTAVGDPIEARAIGNVLGKTDKRKSPVTMGSVKTNIGHLESGAGMAGLIKAALVLNHREVPPNLHFNAANPAIDFTELNLDIPTVSSALPTPNEASQLYASVNSFGFGGANAHAILQSEACPAMSRNAGTAESKLPILLSISAQTADALRNLAEDYIKLLDESPEKLSGICAQSITCRSQLRHRILVTGSTAEEFIQSLRNWLSDTPDKRLTENQSLLPKTREVAFVFSGQGSQWHDMGRDLYARNATFKSKIDLCRDLILDLGGFDLVEELERDESSSNIQKTEIAQPAIFAVQVALVDVWAERGVTPAAVVGHSVGEVAAAHVAGALTLEQAIRVIFHRGDTMGLAGGGKMIAVGISAAEALESIEAHGEALSLAAINGPDSVSISGDPDALAVVFSKFEARGLFCRYVPVDYAFHSAQMDPVESELLARLDGLKPSVPTLPIYSTVSGELAGSADFDAEYWWHNVRETVQFAPAIDRLIDAGFSAFLEISSHPVLKPSLQQCVAKRELHSAVVAYSQHKAEDGDDSLFLNLGALSGSGCRVDLARFARPGERRIKLPRYPFDRERFWRESAHWQTTRCAEVVHPYLVVDCREPGFVWHFWPEMKLFPYLKDHVVNGNAIMPGAGYVEMALAMGSQALPDRLLVIEELDLKRAFPLSDEKDPPLVRLSLDQTATSFRIESCADLSFTHWQLHAEGGLRATAKRLPAQPDLIAALRKRCTQSISPEEAYAAYSRIGLEYGPAFQGIKSLNVGDGEALAEIRIDLDGDSDGDKYFLHPTLLDAAFQAVLAIIPRDAREADISAFLPVWVDRLRFQKRGGDHVFVHAKLTEFSSELIEAEMLLLSPDGEVVARLDGFRCQKVHGIQSAQSAADEVKFLEVCWELSPLRNEPDASPTGAFVPSPAELGSKLSGEVETITASLQSANSATTLEPMSRLCEAYIMAAMVELGFPASKGEEFEWQGILDRTGVVEQHHPLLRQFIGYIVRAGVFSPTGDDSWKLVQDLRSDLADGAMQELLRVQPSATSELFLFTLVSEHLVEALRGEKDIIPILFHAQNSSMLERLYSSAVSARITNEVLTRALRRITEELPAGRTLRILEIGAGTGASAQHYLHALPSGRFELTFTDVSNAFFGNAEKRFHDIPEIVYRTLDISKPPADQGFGARYDIVIAADVLHATEDLRFTLANARQLLRPNGVMMMVDLVSPRHVTFDMIFGLTRGAWVSSNDPLRKGDLALETDKWLQLLGEVGFDDVAVVRDCPAGNEALHSVFICREPDREESFAPEFIREQREWLILADEKGHGDQLADQLSRFGQNAAVMPAPDWREDHGKIIERALSIEDLSGVIYLGALDAAAATSSLSTKGLEDCEEITVHQPTEILQELIGAKGLALPGGVWLVTCGALHVLPDEQPNVSHTPLQGLGRVVFNEIRDLPLRLIDLSAVPSQPEWTSLAQEISGTVGRLGREEDQIAFRGEGRFLPRCYRRDAGAGLSPEAVDVHESPCRLTSTRFGSLDGLCLEATERNAPSGSEVEVKVHAAGLNFRDLMKALKIYPTTIGDARLLGDDFAGEIVAVGDAVTRFSVGDRICGAAMGSFRSYLTCSEEALCRLPDTMSFEEGATILTVYNTAFEALHHVGRIGKGERVLIHSAAGGVGYAAVRLAQLAGAEVFATAGTTTKRKILRQLGVKHVYDSRTLEFADEIMATTRGEGIDMVLNALAGEAIPKSLKCLRLGGRFMEIGKRDIYENTKLGMRQFMNALTFSSIDLGYAIQSGGNREQLQRIEELLASGDLPSLPYSPFPFGDPSEAFRFMSQGKHLGKLVLTMTGQRAHIRTPGRKNPRTYDGNQTALITGGTSGLGLRFAADYLERGIRHFVLVSRSGRKEGNTALEEFMASAETCGATVEVPPLDVADEQGVIDLLAQIRTTLPPLEIIVHSVFTLADELFVKLTREQFVKGMRAKVSGAWNLHRFTQGDPLKEFVVISSLVSIIGTPGQCNYVAANLFLEQLAHLRRAQGLPGLAANLDMINDTGFISRSDDVKDFFSRTGWAGISGDEAAKGIALLVVNDASVKAVYKTKFLRNNTVGSLIGQTNRFQHIFEVDEESDDNTSQRLKNQIAEAEPGARVEVVKGFLREQVAKILRVPVKNISTTLPLNEQGVDSLMAVEFVTLLERQLGITVPTANMTNAPTIEKLSVALLELITGEKADVSAISKEQEPTKDHRFIDDDTTPESDLDTLKDWLNGQALSFGKPARRDRVLLTGANGFLGIYLLFELLKNTDATVACLVRAADSSSAEERLREACDRYQLDPGVLENSRSRWSVVAGDVEIPHFGLDADAYGKLSNSIDVIFHGAAQVSHVAGYHSLRSANVLGTLEIIQLAGRGAPKAVHFASSVAVYSSEGATKIETSPPDKLDEILAGYGQTKAVGEHLMRAAEARGMPLSIYRIGPVVGDDTSGISAHHDFVWLLLKACIVLGKAPESNWNLYLTPVDFASRLLRESYANHGDGITCNFVNPSDISLNDLIEAARRNGFDIETLSLPEWTQTIREVGALPEFAPYLFFRREILDDFIAATSFPVLETAKIKRLMDAAGIEPVDMDEDRTDRFIEYLIESGFLAAPQAAN